MRKQLNSDNSSEDQKKLVRLKVEIEALKRKQVNKERDKKDNFPYGLVTGGGAVIVLLLIAVFFLTKE